MYPSCRCVAESAVSGEMLSRLTVVPAMQTMLEALPPKMLRISTNKQPERVRFSEHALGSRVDDVYALINGATFTGKGDKEKVPLKYRAYATAISAALTDVLVLVTAEEGSAVLLAPPLHTPSVPPAPPLRLAEGQLLLRRAGLETRGSGSDMG